jgi:hypothetical protein
MRLKFSVRMQFEAEVLNPNIKLHILPDKGIREEIIAPVNQGAAPTEF